MAPRTFLPTLLLGLSLLPLGVARAACPEPASRAAVALPVAESVQRFATMDGAGFLANHDKVLRLLPCLAEPLTPAEAAGIHGMMAFDAFLHQDDTTAVNAFRAAFAADPSWTIPADSIPEGHPIRLQLQIASTHKGSPGVPLPDLTPKAILVDGTPSKTAPSDRPKILQRVAADGLVEETVYLPANAPIPAWVAPKLVVVVPPKPASKKHPVGLAGAAGGSLLLAGACYGLAYAAHDAFVHPDTASGYPEDPEALRTRANALTWTSVGAGTLGLGLGALAVVRW